MPTIRVLGLEPALSRKFTRACEIAGSTRAAWLSRRIRLFIAETESRYSDLFNGLTATESLIVEIVASGAAEKEHIAEEGNMPLPEVMKILRRLVDRGVLCVLPKGGKTDQARGAKIKLYFVSPNFSKDK